ncbi:hypothetical protein [Lewinella sp. IMCC34183]|uniref:hypothetical protein n=1 Tax=Lewinella sp. IMCC34183 TaxID=2248762 RepID=UPI000E23A105|nr:hypothetical protein [Lewinella sp. IMCC34183]
MTSRYFLSSLLVFALLLFAAVHPTGQEGPQIAPTELSRNTTGTASGPHLMQYRGFSVSEVLNRISDGPVEYLLNKDPRVDFFYEYPDLNTAEATETAIRALAEYVGGRVEIISVPTYGYAVEAGDSFGDRAARDVLPEGAIKSIDDESVAAADISTSELVDLLNTYRTETYFLNADVCCASVAFSRTATLEELQKDLRESAGAELRPGTRGITTLRIVSGK